MSKRSAGEERDSGALGRGFRPFFAALQRLRVGLGTVTHGHRVPSLILEILEYFKGLLGSMERA